MAGGSVGLHEFKRGRRVAHAGFRGHARRGRELHGDAERRAQVFWSLWVSMLYAYMDIYIYNQVYVTYSV